MFRKITLSAAAALAFSVVSAHAESTVHIEDVDFAHEGPFGKFDEFQLQRGLQVFTEICSGCHGMKFVPIRSLADEGGPRLPDDQVRAYAASLDAVILPDGTERLREWTDKFPVREGEGMGPDLSLMAKARAGFHGPYGTGLSQLFNGMGGPEYIVSILTGYEENPECAPDGIEGLYYNTAFAPGGYPDSCKIYEETKTVVTKDDGTTVEKIEKKEVGRMAPGSWIAMSPPIDDDSVTYADGHEATKHHIAEDVASFLMWSAEPKLVARKQAGFVAVTVLVLLSVLLYLTNKTLWAGIKGKKSTA
jgi:ubiquinol-cytochrome c reductase cytochrome c1 subunit